MNTFKNNTRSRSGMTLMEVMVASGIGSLVLVMVAALTLYGARSFVALGNYSALDQQSRLGIDQMTREIRQATWIMKYDNTNDALRFISFTNTTKAISIKYTWDKTTKNLVSRRSDEAEDKVLLTGCDRWDFVTWTRFPGTNGMFSFTASDEKASKLIDMTWKCSRSARVGTLLNTESVQTAQIVMRNQTSN